MSQAMVVSTEAFMAWRPSGDMMENQIPSDARKNAVVPIPP